MSGVARTRVEVGGYARHPSAWTRKLSNAAIEYSVLDSRRESGISENRWGIMLPILDQ